MQAGLGYFTDEHIRRSNGTFLHCFPFTSSDKFYLF